MIQNQLISYARTAVMLGVGWLLTFAAERWHIIVTPHTQAAIATLIGALIAFGYYVAVRALEARWPQLGILLGVPAKPHYPQIGAKPKGDGGQVDVGSVLLVTILVVVLILLLHGRIR